MIRQIQERGTNNIPAPEFLQVSACRASINKSHKLMPGSNKQNLQEIIREAQGWTLVKGAFYSHDSGAEANPASQKTAPWTHVRMARRRGKRRDAPWKGGRV